MCTFCDDIYPEEDAKDIAFGRGKYKNIVQGGTFVTPDAFIVVDKDGELDIVVNPWDPDELGLVCDIEFCPYCGRKLKNEEDFHCGIEESGGHAYNCNDCPNKCEEWHQWERR